MDATAPSGWSQLVTLAKSLRRQAARPTVRELFVITQAADVAGVPVREICRRIRIGILKAYHLGAGRVRIDEGDLLADSQPRELEW